MDPGREFGILLLLDETQPSKTLLMHRKIGSRVLAYVDVIHGLAPSTEFTRNALAHL